MKKSIKQLFFYSIILLIISGFNLRAENVYNNLPTHTKYALFCLTHRYSLKTSANIFPITGFAVMSFMHFQFSSVFNWHPWQQNSYPNHLNSYKNNNFFRRKQI